jgi:ATP-dependent Clp protease adapter protein ClpS
VSLHLLTVILLTVHLLTTVMVSEKSSAKHVIIVVHEVGKWVSSSEEIFEDVFSMGESEAIVLMLLVSRATRGA